MKTSMFREYDIRGITSTRCHVIMKIGMCTSRKRIWCKKNNLDLGVGYDGDAHRIGVGEMVARFREKQKIIDINGLRAVYPDG